MSGRARLFVDAASAPPFSSSFAIVAHLLRRRLESLGYAVDERVARLPTIDEHLAGAPPPRLDVEVEDGAVDVYFEEVFARARLAAPSLRAQATVFFNLMCFDERTAGSYAGARALVFNSTFLADAFWARLFAGGVGPAAEQVWRETAVWDLPLVLPQLSFADGYEGRGADVDDALLEALDGVALVGHALRPRKLDPVALVAIARNLVALGSAASVRLLVPAVDREEIMAIAAQLGFARAAETSLVFLPQLHNRAMVRVMRASSFGLAYDRATEAFGFYALETVHNGGALFTNGAGNLRHLLPPDHGIRVYDHPSLHTLDARALIAAYRPVAEAIWAARDGRVGAAVGRALIAERYGLAQFDRRFGEIVARGPIARGPMPEPTARLHPDVRAIGDDGVLTDGGLARVDVAELAIVRAVEAGARLSASEIPASLVERRVVCLVPPRS